MMSTFEFADHVVGILIDSKVDVELLEKVHKLIGEKIKKHERLHLYLEFKPGIEIPVFLLARDFISKLTYTKHFKKIAVVTDQVMVQKAVKLKGFLIEAEVDAFTPEERLEAMSWIAE